jgi:predicted  nucleic acid-binding Zn-ribbon protein
VSVIDELLDLQEQDSVIKSLEKQVHDIPKRRKLEQEKLEDYKRELDQARETLERTQKVEAQSQLDSDQQAAQIAKYEKQRQEVKTNNEYSALGRQIESCRRIKAEYDERAERARAHIADVQESIAMFEARLKEESAAVETYVDELRVQLVEAQEKLLAAQEVREGKAAALRTPEKRRFLDYYDRLRKKYFPVVFRVREGNGCPGCHMVLPASKMQQAQRNAKLADTPEKMDVVACDYCGRLIFK